jgi:hypothetical protein
LRKGELGERQIEEELPLPGESERVGLRVGSGRSRPMLNVRTGRRERYVVLAEAKAPNPGLREGEPERAHSGLRGEPVTQEIYY